VGVFPLIWRDDPWFIVWRIGVFLRRLSDIILGLSVGFTLTMLFMVAVVQW
jgi:hypothetical protein